MATIWPPGNSVSPLEGWAVTWARAAQGGRTKDMGAARPGAQVRPARPTACPRCPEVQAGGCPLSTPDLCMVHTVSTPTPSPELYVHFQWAEDVVVPWPAAKDWSGT